MSDKKKTAKGHADGCDGTCNDVHDKQSAVRSIEQSFAAIRADKDTPITMQGAAALEFGVETVRQMRDDRLVPESSLVYAAMSTIGVRVCQIAGIVDLVYRSSGTAHGQRMN